jgi:hypothetical protein
MDLRVVLSCLLLISTPLLFSQEYLAERFWFELESPAEGTRFDTEEGIVILLNEIQWVYSAMLFGASFEYIPPNPARGIEQEFSLELLARVEKEGITAYSSYLEDDILEVSAIYEIPSSLLPWINRWQDARFFEGDGRGEARYFDGPLNRIDAIEDGIRRAIQNALRFRFRSQPYRITGQVVLTRPPKLAVGAGIYYATVAIRLDLDEIVDYE